MACCPCGHPRPPRSSLLLNPFLRHQPAARGGADGRYLSRWETRLVTRDRSPGLLLSLAFQRFGQSCKTGDLGGEPAGSPSSQAKAAPRGPRLPADAPPRPAHSRGLARTRGWRRRGPAAPGPRGSGQPGCRTSWEKGQVWGPQGWTGGRGSRHLAPPVVPGPKAETHLLAASWSRSRRSSIFLCSWGGRVKALLTRRARTPRCPSALPDTGPVGMGGRRGWARGQARSGREGKS